MGVTHFASNSTTKTNRDGETHRCFKNMHLMKMPWADARCLCGSQGSNVAKRQLMILSGHLSNSRTDKILEKEL